MVFGPEKRDTNRLRIEKKLLHFNWREWQRKWRLASKRKKAVWTGTTIFIFSGVFVLFQLFIPGAGYAISEEAQTLLPSPVDSLSDALKPNLVSFDYSPGKASSSDQDGSKVAPRFNASFPRSAASGVTVTDPKYKVKLTLKPKFRLAAPQKNQNRIVYPLSGKKIQAIYTLQPAQIKEDIIVESYQGDSMKFDFSLELPDGVQARMENNGSIGIYGADPSLLSDVTTGTDKDKQLLDNARKNGEKSTLLFSIPAPFVKEYQRTNSKARAWYSLKGTTLTLRTTGLKDASYPLSIDPSVYISTVTRLMNGNNESNIDFDTDNELIQKGNTTGGRITSWTSTTGLNNARWRHSTATYGGYIYTVGGNNGSSAQSTVYWAKFNNSTGAIDSPNPGNGACTNWCTNSAYNLPAAREAGTLVAYNGYLYYLGGLSSAGSRQSTVYIAKLGSNGEPQLWHPTDTRKSNWGYWYSDTALSSERSYLGAVAYNNYLYVIGGATNASTGGVTTVERASITPTGALINWTADTSLPAARYSSSVAVYNDRLYVLGGANSTTTQDTVYVSKINTGTGALGAWQTTAAIGGGAKASLGGSFATVWGGHLYVGGGCSTMNGSGYCTSIANDLQLASINADGTLTDWSTVPGVTNARIGYGLTAWHNNLYAIGGCTAQNTGTGACTATSTTTSYAAVNQAGNIGSVTTSVGSGTSPCAASTWYNCDLPSTGGDNNATGRMDGATIINNGFIYYMGGCSSVASGSVCVTSGNAKSSSHVSYAAIDSSGNITRVASCAGTFRGSWCVITNGLPTGLSAFGYAVFNNTLYIVGGTTGSDWQSNVQRATFNSDGTWGSWSSQTFSAIGLGSAKGYQFVFTRAEPLYANSSPGNLYVIGGCSGSVPTDDGLDCSGSLSTEVYKCSIKTDGSINSSGCTTSGQLQLDSEPSTGGSQGLGLMAGAVYGNYVYLMGGQSPNEAERGEVLYAKIDDSNNIVAASGSSWTTASHSISPAITRGAGFSYNGYLYTLGGYSSGSGGLQGGLSYAKIDVSDGDIGSFATSDATITARWDLGVAVNSGYAYALGGCSTGAPPDSCTAMTGTVQAFQLYNNYSGSPKAYSAATQFGTNRYAASSAINNGFIYVAGGCTTAGTDCTTASASVQYASIDANGTIGSWSATGALPTGKAWGQLEVAGGSLYYIGGQTSGSNNGTTDVYYGTPNATTGTITWSTASNGLPAGRSQHGATVWNDRIYVVGGNNAAGSPTSIVYVSPQLSSGGNITSSWDTGSDIFTTPRSGATAIAYANTLYILGGYNGSTYLNDVQYAKIDSSNGRAGSWSYGTSLPIGLRQADGFAVNGYMYLFGGRSANTTCDTRTLVAPISANTSVASGNNPTGLGAWYTASATYSGNRYGAAAAYSNGKAYVLGGQCGGTMITTTDKVQQTTLQAQPQVAKYSRIIDTDSNVFPSKWLMNGTDFSIGGYWQTQYRSATDSSNIILHESLDNGTNGSATQKSSDAFAFDNCYNNSPGTNKYSNAQYVTPPLSMRVEVPTGTGGGACADAYNYTATHYERFYVRFDPVASLSGVMTFWRIFNDNASEAVAALRLNTAGRILLRDGTINRWTSAVIPTNAWIRIEVGVYNDTIYLRTYEGSNVNGTVPTQSASTPLTDASSDDFNRTAIGLVTQVNATWGLYIDDYKASLSDWVGPAFPDWGQTTSSGDIALGVLNTFTPKDASGNNTNYARWYNLAPTINAEQTYGYPEDISRSPTISDTSLFFTADPNKRMHGGQTFTGGEQQPLDTPKYEH